MSAGYWFPDPAEELRNALAGIARSHISDEFVRAIQEERGQFAEAVSLGLKLSFSVDGIGAGYLCVDDNTFDGPGSIQGSGPTKAEAARDFLEQWHDRYDDDKREREDTDLIDIPVQRV